MAGEFDTIEPGGWPRTTAFILTSFALLLGAGGVIILTYGDPTPRDLIMALLVLVASLWLGVIGLAVVFDPLRTVGATIASVLSCIGVGMMVYFDWRWNVFEWWVSLIMIAGFVATAVLSVRLLARDIAMVREFYGNDGPPRA